METSLDLADVDATRWRRARSICRVSLSGRVAVFELFFDACSLAIAQALCRGHLTSNLISLLWCCTILRYPVSEHLRPEGNSEHLTDCKDTVEGCTQNSNLKNG